MTRRGKRPMEFSSRIKKKLQFLGTRGDIIKSLAELIKNADDAYDRSDEYRDVTPGTIEVAFDQFKSGKGYSIKGFIVRDFGPGMSTERMESIYYSGEGKRNYGSDTSDETRNGAIGVGGKDCFYNLQNCYVLSIQNNVLTVVEIFTDDEGLGSDILEGDDALKIMDDINKNALEKGGLELMSLDRNQTLATFQIPDEHAGLLEKTLVEKLKQFYTLRWIFESDIRTITLTDIFKKNTRVLQHVPLDGELLYEKSLSLPNQNIPYDVHFELRKSEKDLDHNKDYGYGILIQSKRGAILDNSMYEYTNDSAAKNIFGKLTITDWKRMYRSDETVLTNNREGLDYTGNQFNKQIKQLIITQLRKEVEKERSKQGNNPELSKELDNNIKKAFDMINRLIETDSDRGREPENEPKIADVTGIKFGLQAYTFAPEKTKKIRLYFNPGDVPTGSEIGLIQTNEFITMNPPNSISTLKSYEEFTSKNKVPFVEIEVTGKKLEPGKEQSRTTLKAIFGQLTAETEIYIKQEQSLYPPNGFSFLQPKVRMRPNTSRNVKLIIDTNLIAIGTSIVLKSSDDRITFKPENLTVSGPPNIGDYLTEEVIEVTAKKDELLVELSAEAQTKLSLEKGEDYDEIRTAVCKIQVKDKEPPKRFFNGYEFDPNGAPNVRSVFDANRGYVLIHNKSPILRLVFGTNLERIDQKEPDALTLLSDTIIQRVFYEWARHRIDKNQVPILGDADIATEIEREKNRLEYKFGLGIFNIIRTGNL
jgi:hypothetical protein